MPHPFSFSLKSFRGRVLHCAQKKSPPPNRSPPFIRCQHFASDDREGGRKSVKLFFFSISGGERRCIKGTFCGGADVIERESLGGPFIENCCGHNYVSWKAQSRSFNTVICIKLWQKQIRATWLGNRAYTYRTKNMDQHRFMLPAKL